jgi:hypothetical protein
MKIQRCPLVSPEEVEEEEGSGWKVLRKTQLVLC